MPLPDREEHVALRWVEFHFPSVKDTQKGMLILAYGAGMDRGMRDVQQSIEDACKALTDAL